MLSVVSPQGPGRKVSSAAQGVHARRNAAGSLSSGCNDIGLCGVTPYRVIAEWDARVWVASSEDVPGLATGADTFEDLIEKLKVVIPELLVEMDYCPQGRITCRSPSRPSAVNLRPLPNG